MRKNIDMKSYFAVVNQKGHLPDDVRLSLADNLKKLIGKSVRIEISLHTIRRSDAQNSYYWAVVIPEVTRMLRDYGNDVNEYDTHEYLKNNVMKLTKSLIGPDGTPEYIPASSTDITKDDWSNKMEMVYAWAAKNGCVILPPTKEDSENA